MEKTIEQNLLQDTFYNEESQSDKISYIDFKMITFSLSGKDYAIDIMKVKEIAKAGRFTYVPNTSSFVLGVYNLRGDIIPIIDLRIFFNIPVTERKKDDLENLIVVSVDDQSFGIVVDHIDKVVGIQKSSIQPPHPLFGDINIKYISGVVENNNSLFILLDIDRIFGLRQTPTVEAKTEKENFTQESVSTETPTAIPSQAEPIGKKDSFDIDYNFLVEDLKTRKSFYVSSINEDWVKSRYQKWIEERDSDKIQFENDEDAELFLKPFLSSFTNNFWSESYAEQMFKALPENSAKQITVWNPGCGKGYESFSLACVLKKKYPEARIRIYAQDTDLLAVSSAQMITISQEKAENWYQPYLTKTVSGDYTFNAAIKEMVFFEYHDITHNNAQPNVDIIFSRDVLSYLDNEKQKDLLEDFDDKLKGNGVLIIGENEVLTSFVDWHSKEEASITMYTK